VPGIPSPCGPVYCTPESGSLFLLGTTLVSCSYGSGAGCTFTVTVNDVEAPVLTCPDITATNLGQGPVVVDFLVSSFDNCPGMVLDCTPPPGSSFPIGASLVHCAGTDSAGNTAACDFTVHVVEAGPLALLKSVLADLQSLRSTLTGKEQKALDQAIDRLTEALDPRLWLDQTHLRARDGGRVFQKIKETIQALRELTDSQSSPLPSGNGPGFRERLAESGRMLALAAMADMAPGSGERGQISQAIRALAKGDQDIAEGRFNSGVEQYCLAWAASDRVTRTRKR